MTTIMSCARDILYRLERVDSVTLTDYDPVNDEQHNSDIAKKLGVPNFSNDVVRKAVVFLEENRGVLVQRTVVKPAQSGSKGKVYPAQLRVTVQRC